MKNKKKRLPLKIVLIAVAAFCGIAAIVGLQKERRVMPNW